ncbi:DUF3413 domain-containing protein [Otariodibacter oris]|uniref:Inner membrane protein YejM N-terminal domain-containing protein n=1 Tax=Otariodibacter oris TaxID=1032623 RepID=A0A420XHI3_9PAST|nr:DUF3413 domain-containing protein [Otariodibacter oris]QGM81241.1 hypothetical protein A6A10_07375 [Otariodibacter oris]RKR72802.1 hypothetical protein DES31_0968 [Otariodibacter oris]
MLSLIQRLLPKNSLQYREETSRRIVWGHWFALFNIVIALLLSSRYAFNADWPDTLLGKLYFFLSLFGHFSFVIFAFYLLLLFPLSFIIGNTRTFRGISVVVATIGMTVLLVDTEVFKQFYLHLSPLVWDLLVNPDESELSRQWQLLFVPMPLILLVEILYSRWCWQKLRSFNRQKWGKYVAAFFLFAFMGTHLFYALADMSLYRPVTAQRANYPLSYPMTARSFLEKHGLIDRESFDQTIEENGRLDGFFLDYPKGRLQFDNKPDNINVLFINLSGLTDSVITPELMPNLSELSSHSRRFTQHYIAGDTEMAGVASLFYSLSGKYVDAILTKKSPPVLISRLQNLDYQFGLFSHNSFANPIYQALFENFELPQAKDSIDALRQWNLWLETEDTTVPFFSYLDLAIGDINDKQNVQFVDSQLRFVWNRLAAKGLDKNTFILLTSDIGQESTTDNSFAAQHTKVPMLMFWQGDSGIYNGMSSHLDIAPTLLNRFFGMTSPVALYSQGIDLTKENDRRWLLSANYSWDVAIMRDGEQYQINKKGDFQHYNEEGAKETDARPPLALFFQLIHQSNQFVEK